jgi:tetratricopeptide (TPR) repeat protein
MKEEPQKAQKAHKKKCMVVSFEAHGRCWTITGIHTRKVILMETTTDTTTTGVTWESLASLDEGLAELASQGLHDEANSIIADLIDEVEDPEQQSWLWVRVGLNEELAGRFTSALAAYERVRELRPRNTLAWYSAHNNAAWVLTRLGRFEEAIRMARAAIAIDPKRHNAFKNMGLALEGSGEFGEAVWFYGVAACRAPQDRRAIQHLRELLDKMPPLEMFDPILALLVQRTFDIDAAGQQPEGERS